jgi:hypothetical protein
LAKGKAGNEGRHRLGCGECLTDCSQQEVVTLEKLAEPTMPFLTRTNRRHSMKMNKRQLRVMVFGLLTLAVAFAPQRTLAAAHCKAVDADQAVTVTGATTTTGTITRGGILNGTTADVIAPLSILPSAVPTTITFSETLTITTDKGTLTTNDQSIFDTAAGVFSAIAKVTGGTGIFAGATGTLFISGTAVSATEFEDRIIGEICLAK